MTRTENDPAGWHRTGSHQDVLLVEDRTNIAASDLVTTPPIGKTDGADSVHLRSAGSGMSGSALSAFSRGQSGSHDDDFAERIGQKLDPGDLRLSESSRAFLLPPTLVAELLAASELRETWLGPRSYIEPSDSDLLDRLLGRALRFAFAVGWSDEAAVELARWGKHWSLPNYGPERIHGLAVRSANHARWLALGGNRVRSGNTIQEAVGAGPGLPADDVLAYLAALGELSKRHSWTGRKGGTERDVFEWLLDHGATRQPHPTFRPKASVRQIAEGVHKHHETVVKALARLRSAGLVVSIAGSAAESSRHVLRWPTDQPLGKVPETDQVSVGLERAPASATGDNAWSGFRTLPSQSHPAFDRACFGRSGFRLLSALAQGREAPTTDQQWWETAGVSRSSFYEVKSWLDGSEGEAVVERRDGGWNLVDGVEGVLDRWAESSGATKQVAERRVRHQVAREGFGQYLNGRPVDLVKVAPARRVEGATVVVDDVLRWPCCFAERPVRPSGGAASVLVSYPVGEVAVNDLLVAA